MSDANSRLIDAAGRGDVGAVRRALDEGARPDHEVLEDRVWGRTALYLACRNGHLAIVQLLLERGADPNRSHGAGGVYSSTSSSCLCAAAPDLAIMEALLAAGADPEDVYEQHTDTDDHMTETSRSGSREDLTPEALELLRRYSEKRRNKA